MVKVEWTERASADLKEIFEYIASDSVLYADRFVRSLIKATLKLEVMPRSGRVVPELDIEDIREVIFQNYRIVYRLLNPDKIHILAVIHCARDFEKVIKEEWEF